MPRQLLHEGQAPKRCSIRPRIGAQFLLHHVRCCRAAAPPGRLGVIALRAPPGLRGTSAWCAEFPGAATGVDHRRSSGPQVRRGGVRRLDQRVKPLRLGQRVGCAGLAQRRRLQHARRDAVFERQRQRRARRRRPTRFRSVRLGEHAFAARSPGTQVADRQALGLFARLGVASLDAAAGGSVDARGGAAGRGISRTRRGRHRPAAAGPYQAYWAFRGHRQGLHAFRRRGGGHHHAVAELPSGGPAQGRRATSGYGL